MTKNRKVYLVAQDDGNYAFYDRSTDGFRRLASLYNNNCNRFFEVIIEREIKINYGARGINSKEELPCYNEDGENY